MQVQDGRATRRVRLFWRLNVVIYLPFFATPAVDLVEGGHGPVATTAAAVALVAFVATYLRASWAGLVAPGHGERWPSLAICGVTAVVTLALLGPAWAGLITFVAFLAGGTVRRPQVTVVLVVAAAALLALLSEGLSAWPAYVVFVGLFGGAIAWLQRTCEELDRSHADIARLAVADERARFARDLHDLLGHSLSVIALKSELAGRLATTDPARTAAELRDIESVTREALAEVRAAVTGYRTEAGLDAELDRARAALAAAGVRARVEVTDRDLDPDVDELFAWTVREATTNVVRHAGARHCTITVRSDDGGDQVEIVDDGVGSGGATGQGLDGLAERAESASGRFEMSDRPEGGVRVAVEVRGSEVAR